MDASSTVVIKVKYGEMLRRFNARIVDGELDLSMDGLTAKVFTLFGIAPESELVLTYVDEDGDVVTLVDADDLRDVVKQGLNPLRITAKLNSDKNARQFNRVSGSSTPLRSPRVQEPLQNLNDGVSEILKTVPVPLREQLVKVSTDLASKASSSAPPAVTELVDLFSKLGLSYLGQLSEAQARVQPSRNGDVPESSLAATVTEDSDPSKVKTPTLKVPSNGKESSPKLPTEAASGFNKVEPVTMTGGSMETSFSKTLGSNALPSALDSGDTNAGKKVRVNKSHVGPKATKICPRDHVKGGSLVGLNGISSVFPGGSTSSIWEPISGYSKYHGSLFVPSPSYEGPFSGLPVGNTSAAQPQPASPAVPRRRSSIQNDGSGISFHRGVRCDGCGVYPITGSRFKSKVKVDYDLCSICFSEMGNDSDYIRMDRPVAYRLHPFKGLYDPSQPSVMSKVWSKDLKLKSRGAKLDSRFIQDVNVIDGTVMEPLTPFTKIWRLRNNGKAVWPQRTQLVWIDGDKLSNRVSVEVEIPATGLPVDHELDVAVDFVAPELPGQYISYWRMASPSGQKFGQRVWVLIQVDAFVQETQRESIRDLNLNLPPVSGPEIINAEVQPIMEGSHPEPANSGKTLELVEPVVDMQPNNEQEMKSPINDNLIGGTGASSFVPYPVVHMPVQPTAPPAAVATDEEFALELPVEKVDKNASSAVSAAGQSVSYPIIHTPEHTRPVPAMELPRKEEAEEQLLRELEQMGFRQVDLNKKILRMNGYDLEQAVDYLCGVSEWDPILEELLEMGFHDTETNKMLLKKNNGSIKRVVMDLIAGEKM